MYVYGADEEIILRQYSRNLIFAVLVRKTEMIQKIRLISL